MSFSGPFIFSAIILIISYNFVNSVEDIPVPGGNTTTTTSSPPITTTSTKNPNPVPPTPNGFGHHITIRFNSIAINSTSVLVDERVEIEHDGVIEQFTCFPTFHWRLLYFVDQYIYHNTSHASCINEPKSNDFYTFDCSCFNSVLNKFVHLSF